MAYSDRTYVGTGTGPEWVTVYNVEHFTLLLIQMGTAPSLLPILVPTRLNLTSFSV